MQRLEVSRAVRPIYGSLGVKRLRTSVIEKQQHACTTQNNLGYLQTSNTRQSESIKRNLKTRRYRNIN